MTKRLDEREAIIAWHFTQGDFLASYSLANNHKMVNALWKNYKVEKEEPPIRICEKGLHASRYFNDAFWYYNSINYQTILRRVACWGNVEEDDDKLVCSRRRVLWYVPAEKYLKRVLSHLNKNVLHKRQSIDTLFWLDKTFLEEAVLHVASRYPGKKVRVNGKDILR